MIFTAQFSAWLRRRLGLWVALICLVGCGPEQAVRVAAPPPDPTATAQTYLSTGNYTSAAVEYQRLASSADGAKANRYLMLAALAYQDANDFDTANALLAEPPIDDPTARTLQALANARTLVRERLAERALEQLRLAPLGQLTPYLRSIHHRTEGQAEVLLGHYARALDVLLAADKGSLPQDQLSALQYDIWNAVSHLNDNELTTLANTASPIVAGWGELALIAKNHMDDSAAFPDHMEQWKQRFPHHRAQPELTERLLELTESLSVRPKQVALLLPFDTRFADAAIAVRDGFLTAWYSDPRIDLRPIVEIYDTGETDVVQVYERAVSEGADFIVGPLRKSDVQTLADKGDLAVPVLALNTADAVSVNTSDPAGIFARRFYQFGLVPEDEARQPADRAWSDGYRRAIAFAPESDWGERLLKAFAERWRDLGGVMLNQSTYASDTEAYATSVKQALNIDLSEARAAALRKLLRTQIEFEPRRRKDVDFIFLTGSPIDARQLLPQLRYFRAEDVPVYATSQIFSGVIDADHDQDLNGVIFGDMPWLVGAADTDSFNAVRRGWGDDAKTFRRLYALGIDVYRVIRHLKLMQLQQGKRIPGATGSLSLDADGRIHRTLTWLQFNDGVPTLISGSGRIAE